MKEIIVVMLLFAIVASLTACNKIADSTSSSSETSIVKEVTSDDILKTKKEMTSKEIMDSLGEIVCKPGARAWFIYIVDGKQYLQRFSELNAPIGLSGEETLEIINMQNAENPPKFIPVKEALENLKTTPAGGDLFCMIEFADSDFIWVSFEAGSLFFRYNIKENKIDKALDCRDFISYYVQDRASVGSVFKANGKKGALYLTTSGENKDSLE